MPLELISPAFRLDAIQGHILERTEAIVMYGRSLPG